MSEKPQQDSKWADWKGFSWSKWTDGAGVFIVFAALVSVFFRDDKVDVSRPIYSSQADCLADWANTPSDCKEENDQKSSIHIRRWYGPWMEHDSTGAGTVYHENGTTSTRSASSMHATAHTGTSRMGFGGSHGGRGG